MTRLEVVRGEIATFEADAIAKDEGPVWQGGDQGEPGLLFRAYYSAVQVAAEAGAKTVAVPSMSTGLQGYPLQDAAEVAVAALLEALADFMMIDQVTIVTHSDEEFAVYTDAIEGIFD